MVGIGTILDKKISMSNNKSWATNINSNIRPNLKVNTVKMNHTILEIIAKTEL